MVRENQITFFLLQLTPAKMKRILHSVSVKNITFKSSYNLFKIDIHQQLRLRQLLSHIQSHLNYYIHDIKPKLSAKHVFTVRE